jgi:hypothetical protein
MRSFACFLAVVSLLSLDVVAAERSETKSKAATSGGAELEKLRVEVRAAIKASDRVTKENRDQAVRRLISVHERVKQSPVTGDERDQLEQRVEARLAHLADVIQRQVAREAAAPNVRVPAQGAVLAQQGLQRAGFAQPGFAQNAAGFGFGPNRQAGFGVQPPDHGQDLVELIQRTIAPSSWDVNGGPGAIVYFSPLRALVVRNRSEIHEQLGDVVGQMRRQ